MKTLFVLALVSTSALGESRHVLEEGQKLICTGKVVRIEDRDGKKVAAIEILECKQESSSSRGNGGTKR